MVKLIIGVKGTGKTKTLIEMVNAAQNETKGNVVCIEKGDKLIKSINDVAIDDDITLRVSDGIVTARVTGVSESKI